MQQRKQQKRMHGRLGRAVVVAAGLVALAWTPAVAGDVYTWRTEDGGVAFTDDPKAIPPHYRAQAQRRAAGSLDRYERYTPLRGQAEAGYEQRVIERLTYLRALNRALAPREAAEGSSEAASVTLRTGGAGAPSIEIPADDGSGPVVVEDVFYRRRGSAVVQPVKVVKRGDEVIAVIKPRARQWNINDFVDEDDLLER